MLEKYVLQYTLKRLKLAGINCWRNQVGAFKIDDKRYFKQGERGVSDILGWTAINNKAIFLAVECKSDKGKLSAYQKAFKEKLERDGGLFFCIHSPDEADEMIKELTKKR